MVAQSGDGYKCTCGQICEDLDLFRKHQLQGYNKDGKGVHKSAGRVNMETGEITMPPWTQRTPEQKTQSHFAKRREKKDGKALSTPGAQTTSVLAQATEIKFIPRAFATTYTTIMQQAQHAAIKEFGWRKDMPFENFLDTVLFNYFYEHGVTLGGYVVDDALKKWKDQVPSEATESKQVMAIKEEEK